MTRLRVKICCISSLEEAALAVAAGADALGLVGAMPSGPGVISDERAREIALSIPPPAARVLLSSRETAADLAAHLFEVGADVLQVVRMIAPAESARLRRMLPRAARIFQVIHVEGPEALELIPAYAPHAEAFLLDSGRPSAAELGGTGRKHDWRVSRAFVEASPRPVFLAGGLHPGNAAEAARAVRPFGLDVCSGLRRNGALDAEKLAGFMEALTQA